MDDLSAQLRVYIDAIASPVAMTELDGVGMFHLAPPTRHPSWTRPAVAVTAAALVLAGIVVVLARGDGPDQPARPEPAPDSTSPDDTVPTATTANVPDAPAEPTTTMLIPPPVEPEPGTGPGVLVEPVMDGFVARVPVITPDGDWLLVILPPERVEGREVQVTPGSLPAGYMWTGGSWRVDDTETGAIHTVTMKAVSARDLAALAACGTLACPQEPTSTEQLSDGVVLQRWPTTYTNPEGFRTGFQLTTVSAGGWTAGIDSADVDLGDRFARALTWDVLDGFPVLAWHEIEGLRPDPGVHAVTVQVQPPGDQERPDWYFQIGPSCAPASEEGGSACSNGWGVVGVDAASVTVELLQHAPSAPPGGAPCTTAAVEQALADARYVSPRVECIEGYAVATVELRDGVSDTAVCYLRDVGGEWENLGIGTGWTDAPPGMPTAAWVQLNAMIGFVP